MIIYHKTKEDFSNDVLTNEIDKIITQQIKLKTGKNTGASEINSFKNSLSFMDRVLHDKDIPEDCSISIEYHIPQTAKRVDFIIAGSDGLRENVIIVELKQWSEAFITDQDGIVETRFKGGVISTSHPSYQAYSYTSLLQSFNSTIEEDSIFLQPCAYLHNYEPDDVITNSFYEYYLEKAPVFLKPDASKLREFIKKFVKYGDKTNIIARIDNRTRWERIRPGDVVLFCWDNNIRYMATATGIKESEQLAQNIWGVESRNFKYIYFLQDVTAINPIPNVDLNRLLVGDTSFQGFQVLEDHRCAQALTFLANNRLASIGTGAIRNFFTTKINALEALDINTSQKGRAEQALIRNYLKVTGQFSACAICGQNYPDWSLTTSHLKKRSKCNDAEKKDFENICLPMCLFGCDTLYEKGYLTINNGLVAPHKTPGNTTIQTYIDTVIGKRVLFWNEGRRGYAEWHRDFHTN